MDPDELVLYRRACPAFFDDNLTSLVPALQGELLLAHVRAATYRPEGIVVDENCHPFRFFGASHSRRRELGTIRVWRNAFGGAAK